MPTLAPKLPWTHAFAGGYPRRGGQPLPTDPDAIDYLNRVAAADGGVSVEVGIAQAIDAFVRGCKADSAGYAGDPTRSNWDAIQSSCIMCGARTLSGALVPLKTPYGPELWDGTQSLESIADSGTNGAYDAVTQTMTNTTGTAAAYPRFRFALAQNLQTGKQYRISGRLSGDLAAVYGIRPRNGSYIVSVNATTGVFDGTVRQDSASTSLEILLNASVQSSISVRIESLSIREDSFTPTPYNVASGDYSRTTGLKGDGTTKYLDSNRANNADGQDDQHAAFYASQKEGSNKTTLGSYSISTASGTHFSDGSGFIFTRSQSVNQTKTTATSAGFNGVSRSDSAAYSVRSSGSNTPVSVASAATAAIAMPVFAFNYNGTIQGFSSARLAFYSIGSALDLAALDNRVSTLVAAIAAAT